MSESFKHIKTVTPIQGAQKTTMSLEAEVNPSSFFEVTLEDGSVREGWCVEYNDDYVKGEQKGVKLYSTKGHPAWETLNYFMSIKDQLRMDDPSLTYREIQVIIWSLIDNPSFDIDKINEYGHMPSSIYSNGEAHFDVQKVKDIVADIHSRKADSQFKTLANQQGVTLIQNDGQTIMMGDETAFAVKTVAQNGDPSVDADYSTCFDEEIIANVSFNRWGWTNGPISEGSGEQTYDIYAGAGQCDLSKGTLVGQLTANYANGTLTVTYRITEESFFTNELYTLLETHLFVGSAPYPQMNNNKYTVAPGQYGNQNSHDNITEYTYEVSGLSGDIYFIAHSVINGFGQ
ncbi:hypothetical protein CK503_14290 [Aliifodinibius salipaludis]|uniref:Uncharacterized protein n=1 Tax=Fodinibius salipaludis TaxID=2032627 RepID=A0A2A2G7P8_9BACT|nr:hypothetical protein CK503_14290 [Aliifodinibius salipaludis]